MVTSKGISQNTIEDTIEGKVTMQTQTETKEAKLNSKGDLEIFKEAEISKRLAQVMYETECQLRSIREKYFTEDYELKRREELTDRLALDRSTNVAICALQLAENLYKETNAILESLNEEKWKIP